MRIIINADDCGYNKEINTSIERAIQEKKITSTTIMANMNDLSGGVSLFKQYNSVISFGCHLNLTEGKPLTNSQLLLDKGYFVEKNGEVFLNGKVYWNKFLSKSMRKEIYRELQAQVETLLDYGVEISHFDSHHHIHTNLYMMSVIADLARKYNVGRIRRVRNYVPVSLNFYARQVWACGIKILNNKIRMTDYFCTYSDFYKNPNLKDTDSWIELECHPGGKYHEEENLLFTNDLSKDYQLLSYNEI